jgi:23S rRNA pseudouridine2605 synthase
MSRRRSFHAEGPRPNTPSNSRGSRPGAKRRPRPTGGPGNDQAKAPRHEAGPRPRLFKEAGGIEPGKQERLQKVLAHAGLGSRRACETFILQGRVSINGEIVRQLGTRIDPAAARIAVDGEPIQLESMVYYAINKPTGYVSTNFDPSGRPRVVDLLPEIPQRVYTVGRLDEDSTGLIILTNDGDLANRLAHPRYGVEKLYRALVAGLPTPEMLAKLTEGIWLSDGKVRAKRARITGRQGQATLLELVLAEGKKREIRRMLSKLGHKVMSLNRLAVGPVSLKGLSVGECRPLTRHEIELLRKVASGVAVSLPRFFDGDSTNRPHRGESRQPRRPQHAGAASDPNRPAPRRSHSNDEASERRPPRHAQQANSPRPRSERPQHSRPGAPKAVLQNIPPPGDRQRRKPLGKLPPKQRSHAKTPVDSRRASGLTPPPPEPPRNRRIIGLAVNSVAPTGPNATGGRNRKRPPARKRPAPRPTPGKKPTQPPESGSHEDEIG